MLAQAALREIDAAAEPVRAALLLRTLGYLKYHLGRTDYAGDLEEAVRLVPAEPASPAWARVLEGLAHYTLKVHGGWDNPKLRSAAEEAVAAARQSGDAATEAAALVTLACAEPIGGNMERVRAMLAQARAIAAGARAFQPLLGTAITNRTCWRTRACTNRPPRWPGRDSRPPANTGSRGPTARCWPTTWPSRWSRWAGGTRPVRSSSTR